MNACARRVRKRSPLAQYAQAGPTVGNFTISAVGSFTAPRSPRWGTLRSQRWGTLRSPRWENFT
eukprot:10449001-Alexandrium_andersonii.AAC.1